MLTCAMGRSAWQQNAPAAASCTAIWTSQRRRQTYQAALFCRCGHSATAHAAASWPAQSGLRHPPDEGSGSNGMWNLGNLIHDFEKMRKIVGGRIGADFD